MPQLTYPSAMPVAFAGMLADSTDVKQVESFFSAEASAEIPFGVMVKQGSGDFTANLLTAITEKLVGVVVHSHTYEPVVQLGTNGGILPKNSLGLLAKGRIWVTVEDAVTPASQPYVRAVAVAPEQAGAFRGTADGTDTIKLYGSRFITSASAAGLAMLEIDLDAYLAAVAALTSGATLFAPHA